jgi:uncharacterized protein (DUF1330 family)
MSYYFIAQIRINEESEYQKYIDNSREVFNKHRGKYLAVDDEPVIVEGNWDYTRTVLIAFESKSDFETWYYSDEYQRILKYRLKAAVCDSVLVKGFQS